MEEHKTGTSQPLPEKPKGVFSIWEGLALTAQITGCIIGPLILVGGFGYWLDRKMGGQKVVFFVFMIIAFCLSNYLVWRKSREVLEKYKR